MFVVVIVRNGLERLGGKSLQEIRSKKILTSSGCIAKEIIKHRSVRPYQEYDKYDDCDDHINQGTARFHCVGVSVTSIIHVYRLRLGVSGHFGTFSKSQLFD